MKEWIELPEFDSNLFQPGDWIRCYDITKLTGYVDKGYVKETDGDLVIYTVVDSEHIVHYKTCRKLVQDELKQFWIKKGDAFSYGRGVLILAPDDPENWIKVIEVKGGDDGST